MGIVRCVHDLDLGDGFWVRTCVKIDQIYEVYASLIILDAVPKKWRYSLTQKQFSFLVKCGKC